MLRRAVPLFLGISLNAFSQSTPKAPALPAAKLSAVDMQQAALQQQRDSFKKQQDSIERQRAVAGPVKISPTEFIAPLPPSPTMPAMPISIVEWDCDPIPSNEIDSLVSSAAKREDLSPAVLRAVIRRESGFKPCAVSVAGAEGLMQLMPQTAQELHVADPFDPWQNVRGGAAFLKQLLKKYNGDLSLALSAYNAGSTRVDQARGVPAIDETQNYVASILDELSPLGPKPVTDASSSSVPPTGTGRSVVLHLTLDPDQIAPAAVSVNLPQ